MRRALLSVALALSGCRSCERPPPRGQTHGVAFVRCAQLEPGTARESYAVAPGRTVTREGPIARDPRPAKPEPVIAVLGGPHGADPHDARLESLARGLRDADAVVVLGGLAGDARALGAWADAVLPRGVPALLVPADTESLRAFREALATLARARPELLDGTRVRALLAADVELVTVPGTPWPALSRAHEEGCGLVDEDLAALASALPRPAAPRIMVSAVAPAQRGSAAIDRGLLGTHVGSEALARAVGALGARGVAALLPRESVGALSELSGERALRVGDALSEGFALSVGQASSDPVEALDGTLVGPVAWRLRVGREGTRVERVGP